MALLVSPIGWVAPGQAGAGREPTALSDAAAAEPARPRWQWPLSPAPDVVEPFRPPAKKWLSGHRGVDLAASAGDEVRSPAAGTVSFSGTVVDRGVITVTTPEGRRISFEPVAEPLPRGTRVTAGQRIAVRDPDAMHEGCGGCLHWGVREGEDYVNPLLFVQDLEPSILLPVPEQLRPRADSGRAFLKGREPPRTWGTPVVPTRPSPDVQERTGRYQFVILPRGYLTNL